MIDRLSEVPRIEYSEEKNVILRATRGIGFEEVIEIIQKGHTVIDLSHHRPKKYPNQRIFVVNINNYAYAIPYVYDKKGDVIFLKTIYPDRVLTKRYIHR